MPPEVQGVAARAERRSLRVKPSTYRSEYVRRAEKELQERGAYSWTADIRSRVRIARSVCRSEGEFRSLLAALGVTVSDNSPKAPRRDWVYAFADYPSRRVSGERLGLSYGRERLEPMLRTGGMGRFADSSERAIADIAKSAVEVGSIEELHTLSKAITIIQTVNATCLADLDALAEKGASGEEVFEAARYARAAGLLPEDRPDPRSRRPASASNRKVAGRAVRVQGSHEVAAEPARGDAAQARARQIGRREGPGR